MSYKTLYVWYFPNIHTLGTSETFLVKRRHNRSPLMSIMSLISMHQETQDEIFFNACMFLVCEKMKMRGHFKNLNLNVARWWKGKCHGFSFMNS